jgi:hypothetical protein
VSADLQLSVHNRADPLLLGESAIMMMMLVTENGSGAQQT